MGINFGNKLTCRRVKIYVNYMCALSSSELTNVNFSLVSSAEIADNDIDAITTTTHPMNDSDAPLSNLKVESTVADDVEGEEEDDDETCKTSANESRKFCVHFSQS